MGFSCEIFSLSFLIIIKDVRYELLILGACKSTGLANPRKAVSFSWHCKFNFWQKWNYGIFLLWFILFFILFYFILYFICFIFYFHILLIVSFLFKLYKFINSSKLLSCRLGLQYILTAPLLRGKTPPTRLPVGCGWWPIMLEDGILVAEQSLTQQLKRSLVLKHSTLALTELDRWSERADPINWLVMSALF